MKEPWHIDSSMVLKLISNP